MEYEMEVSLATLAIMKLQSDEFGRVHRRCCYNNGDGKFGDEIKSLK